MYAVVRTGGKQYKVALGDYLRVDRLECKVGASINLDDVLMVADGETVNMGTPTLDTPVSATVVSHGRGKKIKVFKMRRRKNYRRTQGHRQDFTELKITAIGDHTVPEKPQEGDVSQTAEVNEMAGMVATGAPLSEPDSVENENETGGQTT